MRAGWRAEPVGQAVGGSTERHFGQGFTAKGAQLSRVGAQLVRVLLGAPDRHLQELGHLRQPDRVGQGGRPFEQRWHEALLVVHEHELGVVGV